ncbi:hypothetical protein GCM10020000_77240 [Streptomyces olivoverticillatus]
MGAPAGRKRGAARAARAASGTLTRKVDCQPKASVSTPPVKYPADPPVAATAPRMASALLRRAFSSAVRSGKTTISRDRAVGEMTAAARPWAARAATSSVGEEARPPTREAAEKTSRPAVNTERRPSRSPSRPPKRRNPPNARA